MRFIADVHVHSKYSRATSRDMTPERIWQWAQLKGITVIGTGDFTHPGWMQELQEKLEPAGNGLFRLKSAYQDRAGIPVSCHADVYFILSAEISCIYRKNEKTRKVHAIILMPDFTSALHLNAALARIGNLAADGRPILGLDARQLLRMALEASADVLYVPAHVWTPHFSVFGAASGFDSLDECFDDLTPHVHAIETGLSSDPPMNWRLSALDRITLLSNSDAHSPAKIGREANIFETECSYGAMAEAVRTRKGFGGTIEFFPEEGKYHYDGHRTCGVCLTPQESVAHQLRCPVCGRKLTIGVMHRVDVLADREAGNMPEHAPGYRSIIPLPEIIAETIRAGVNTKGVERIYRKLLEQFGNEFHILMDVPLAAIEQAGEPRLAEAVGLMRQGAVQIAPGYDGEFGKIRIFGQVRRDAGTGQALLL